MITLTNHASSQFTNEYSLKVFEQQVVELGGRYYSKLWLDVEGAPCSLTPDPDGGPVPRARHGDAGQHVVSHVTRNHKLSRQGSCHQPRLIGQSHPHVGDARVADGLLPRPRGPRTRAI